MYDRIQDVARKIGSVEAQGALARRVALVIGGTLLLAASAKWQVPFYPVPMTMQAGVVLLIGALFGFRLASATVALYLIEGLVGLPVFAGYAAGPAYVFGPTGGYLIGFLIAAALIGKAADLGLTRHVAGLTATMAIGHALIFVFGFAWLATLLGADKAWTLGVAPFFLASVLKTALAVALGHALARFRIV